MHNNLTFAPSTLCFPCSIIFAPSRKLWLIKLRPLWNNLIFPGRCFIKWCRVKLRFIYVLNGNSLDLWDFKSNFMIILQCLSRIAVTLTQYQILLLVITLQVLFLDYIDESHRNTQVHNLISWGTEEKTSFRCIFNLLLVTSHYIPLVYNGLQCTSFWISLWHLI